MANIVPAGTVQSILPRLIVAGRQAELVARITDYAKEDPQFWQVPPLLARMAAGFSLDRLKGRVLKLEANAEDVPAAGLP